MVLSLVTQAPLVVRADDGEELALWRHEPGTGAPGHRGTGARGHGDTGAPGHRGTGAPILLVHGTFSNRFFFGGANGLAQFLADRGHDAWVAELRGRRARAVAGAGDWEFEDWIVRDAPAIARAVTEATGAPKLLWIGHSAGAVIGAGFAARSTAFAGMLSGLVLLAAPAPHAPGAVHVATTALGHLVASIVGKFPADRLRIGPADERPGILRQWFRWNSSGRWIGRDGFDYADAAARVAVPAIAIAGDGDLLTPPSACRRLLDALGGADHEMVVCGRAQGFSHNFTHNQLVLSPAARQEVWPVVARWIEERRD